MADEWNGVTEEKRKCEMCLRFPMGGYDFGCNVCMARAYVRASKEDQTYTHRMWKESMDADQFDEMRRLVADERRRNDECRVG